MKAKHRSKCKSTYRNVSAKSSSIQRISTGDGEYVIYCDPTGILSKNKSPSPERHADPNVDVLNIPASIKVVTPEQLNNSISQAQAGLPEFQPTLSIPPLQFVRPQYQIPATIMPVHQQTQAQQQGLFVPQSNSIYLPPAPPPPPAPYIPSPIDTSLQTINKNIIQVFEVVMAMKQSVDKLKEDMASVKAYIDKEKDMIPVLITDKQVVPPTAAAAPQPPPQMMANYVPPIMASTRLAPSATTTMNVPSIVNSFNPRPRAPAPVRPMLRHMAPPVLVPPKAFAPKPQKPSVPVKKAQPPPPPPVVVQEPIVIEESLEPEQFVEETIEYLQGDDRDSPILEIRDDDPLLDLDWPIEVDITDDEGELQTAETEKEDGGESITFKVTSVEDFNKMNEFLKKNEKYKKQLKEIFDAGREKKTESFSNWFTDEFLDMAIWSTPQNRIFGQGNYVELRDRELTQLLEESWAGDQTFRFQEFVRLQLYNAKTRMVKKRESARRDVNLSKSKTTIITKTG